MSFIQTMSIRCDDPDALGRLLQSWHEDQAGVAPGYLGARVLADRDRPGHHLIEVEFSSAEEAKQNNDRPETAAWAQSLRELVEGDPEYADYDLVFTTG